MSRLIKFAEAEGYEDIISENHGLLEFLALGKISLKNGSAYTGETKNYEFVLVILSGTVSVYCESEGWRGLGERNSVFNGKATAVYIPCQSEYKIIAEKDAQIAVCKARADEKFKPFIVKPNDVTVNQRGKKTWKREVHDIVSANDKGCAQRIIVGETYNHPGSWSSYPPHKHDFHNLPKEAKLEEIYHYQMEPNNGAGVQLLYTQDKSIQEAHIIEHGDSFIIDKGYHPIGALGGYQVYYLWFLAGKMDRILQPYDDPEYKWLI